MGSFIYSIFKVHCFLIRVWLYSFANYLEKNKLLPLAENLYWPVNKEFIFSFLFFFPFSNYYTNTNYKEDVHLETLDIYSVDPYSPAN